MHIRRPSEPRLLAILCLAIGSFLASTLIAQIAERRQHGNTRAILDDALPSIEHLALLRSELFREELLLRRFTAAEQGARPVIRTELDATRAAIERETTAYEAMPALMGERPLTIELRGQLLQIDRALAAVLQPLGGENSEGMSPSEGMKRLETALDAAQVDALQLLDLEDAKAAAFTLAIESAHARMRNISYGLDVVAALFTVLLAAMAWRAVRYYIEHQEAQALELDRFAGRVAHDIVNPLSAVGLALGLIKKGLPPEQLIPRAQASLKRADEIVEALLHFARAGGAPAAPGAHCGVRGVLEGVVADAAGLARERGASISLEIGDDLSAACHCGTLASIAGNLVSNAIKYLGDGKGPRRVSVRASGLKQSVRVEVEDSGAGIPLAMREAIFEPFVRVAATSQPGIGLGLATAKRLCEAHGGQIGLSSTEGRGSIFWFELPRAKPQGAPAESRAPAAAPAERASLH